jgi:hypothetical protein
MRRSTKLTVEFAILAAQDLPETPAIPAVDPNAAKSAEPTGKSRLQAETQARHGGGIQKAP